MTVRRAVAFVVPFLALALQWLLWPWVEPFVWFMFLPALFISAQLGGRVGGLVCTVLSAAMVWYAFIPTQFAWTMEASTNFGSVALFLFVGYLVSAAQGRLDRARQSTSRALDQALAARETLSRFSRVIEQTASTVVITDPNGVIEYVNPRFVETSGYPAREAIGRRPSLLKSGHTTLEQYRELWDTIKRGEIWQGELLNRRKDGTLYWESTIISPVRDEAGKVTHFAGIKDDITARKQAEAALRESETRFRQVFEHAATGIAISGWDGRIEQCNPAFCMLLGYAEGELRGRDFDTLVHPDDREANLAEVRLLRTGAQATFQVENRYVRSDGAPVWVRKFVSLLPDGNGGPARLLALVTDMTARRAAEDALRASENLLVEAQRMAHVGNWRWDFRADRAVWSDEMYRIFGLDTDQPPPNYEEVGHYFTEDSWVRLTAAADRAVSAGEPFELDLELIRADGERRWVVARGEPVCGEGEEIVELRGMMQDITERKRAEQARREHEARLAGIVGSAMDAVISVDAAQRIRLFNPAAERMFGLSAGEAIGKPLERLIPERFRAAHRAQVREFGSAGKSARTMGSFAAVTGLRANGEEFPVEASVSRVDVAGEPQFTVILRDISERVRSERALRELRAEMEQMLTLQVATQTAAAIAHELNQPLNAVASYTEAAERMLDAGTPQPERLRHALEHSARQAQRAGRVVRELLAFLHKGETAVEPIDLNEVVERALAIVQTNGYGGFEAVVELEPTLPPVLANRMQVEKVLVTLVSNGVEAMREATSDPRRITITLRAAEEGGMARVTVQDTGPGLDAAAARRVFQPFYTTKAKGIGLGLTVSRSLVEAHGGKLWADPDAGPGATFHFTLPFSK